MRTGYGGVSVARDGKGANVIEPGRFVAYRVPVHPTTWRHLMAVPGQLQLATSGQIPVVADEVIAS
jgi:hypothetical protein